MADNNNILDIINGISQAAANAYDGALDENGEPIKVGLKREEGDPILDKRVMDGFNVLLSGNTMTIKYHGEIMLKDVHRGDFESNIDEMMADIVAFLKKEYRKITGNSLTLKKLGEPDVLVQSMSKIRSWVQANCKYEIGGIPAEPELGSTVEERLDNSIKKWLGMGKTEKANRRYNVTPLKGQKKYPGAPKVQNVKGKRDEEPRG